MKHQVRNKTQSRIYVDMKLSGNWGPRFEFDSSGACCYLTALKRKQPTLESWIDDHLRAAFPDLTFRPDSTSFIEIPLGLNAFAANTHREKWDAFEESVMRTVETSRAPKLRSLLKRNSRITHLPKPTLKADVRHCAPNAIPQPSPECSRQNGRRRFLRGQPSHFFPPRALIAFSFNGISVVNVDNRILFFWIFRPEIRDEGVGNIAGLSNPAGRASRTTALADTQLPPWPIWPVSWHSSTWISFF